MTKTKVAVLGGGAGAMAATLELLRTPEHRAALDVTVYQMGWRLGDASVRINGEDAWLLEDGG